MEALIASYGDSSSDSESSSLPRETKTQSSNLKQELDRLPPPPIHLLNPPNAFDYFQMGQGNRVRNFEHVEGNYALHVHIPVHIPLLPRKELAQFLKKISSHLPALHVVDADIPLNILCKDDQKLEQIAIGKEFHISLGRTVPIRVHQIDSILTMLRQKLQFQRRYWIDFNKWAVFINDDCTRSFLSMEVIAGGLVEITRQIQAVNEIYRLHNLPEFYKDARPHISLAWALGDITDSLKRALEELSRYPSNGASSYKTSIFTCKFSGIDCKIGKKVYNICKFAEE
ncbi:hypothetical protein GIB67_021588 [Kingdonia uniflora]|uniref:U6 snRNA phosphodiesterase n=1 Tax=Kingdonia uniflora TaxID=39325 RepID=A0A7J7MDJ7_9MAGN|nr:hypothetical protein GIB67_021588 [Kingdonia uniflora]